MKKGLLFLAVVILCISCAYAAEISGEIYDLSLEKVKDIVVTINTVPEQRIVAKEGSYSFNVPVGQYRITAKKDVGTTTYCAEENITVKDDGKYRIDLFLYPEIDTNDETPEIGNELFEEKKKNNVLPIALLVSAIAIIFSIISLLINKRKKTNSSVEGEDEVKKIIGIIRKQGGRTTQKEIRKEMPYSEAKISLMIAELEHKGMVEKIKKGRGNIIILKR
ncbi:hypothetical protein JXA85_08660 [Candidatus Woesearchaeota archaeon]|nr:hypothetical protein [Candidatus Woesearchaeota archaeon]